MSVPESAIRAAIQQVEQFPNIADLRSRPRDYMYTVLNLVRLPGNYPPSRAESMEAWLMILLSESSNNKVVLTSAISRAITKALEDEVGGRSPSVTPGTSGAADATTPADLGNDFPGRKVEQ